MTRSTRGPGDILRALGVLLLVLRPGAAANAATFYVSPTGSDQNAGSQALPFKTLGRGCQSLSAGDTLDVAAGTYAEALTDVIPAGADGAPVTIEAQDPASRPVLAPSRTDRVVLIGTSQTPNRAWIVLDGLVFDGKRVKLDAIKLTSGANHVTIRNGEVRNAPQQGILLSGAADHNTFTHLVVHDNGSSDLHHGIYVSASDNVIDGCEFYRNAGWGVHVYDGSSAPHADRNVISNCRSHDNARTGTRGAGIGLYSGTGNEALNDRVWNNLGGILTDYGATDTRIENNTVWGNRSNDPARVGVYIGAASSNALVVNNIVGKNAGQGITSASPGVTQIMNNLTFGNGADGIGTTGTQTTVAGNLIGVDPLLVDPANADYRLQAGSPAIDAGLPYPDTSPDCAGTARPAGLAWDLGAFEGAVGP